jgi:hypothetical protein
MNTRSKIIATVAVLWIALLAVIAFQTLSTDETKRVVASPTTAQQRQIDDCVRTGLASTGAEAGGGAEIWDKQICAQEILPTPTSEPDYDVAGAAAKAAAASLIALVIIGATVIWTRPKADEQVVASTPNSSPPAPKPKAAQTTVETVASSAADPASALRQLKALHDEGILTDDEYKTKRQALADQL